MATLINNTADMFNWDEVISWCEKDGGTHSGLVQYGDDYMDYWHDTFVMDKDKLDTDITHYWVDLCGCGYRWDLIWWQWIDTERNQEFIDKFSKHVKLKHLKSFVSRLDPGGVAPPHWDECDSAFRTPTNWDKIYRCVVFLNPPSPGQAFVLKDHCHYDETPGNLYMWDDYTDFHAAFNTSTQPQYLFHFIGTTDGYED